MRTVAELHGRLGKQRESPGARRGKEFLLSLFFFHSAWVLHQFPQASATGAQHSAGSRCACSATPCCPFHISARVCRDSASAIRARPLANAVGLLVLAQRIFRDVAPVAFLGYRTPRATAIIPPTAPLDPFYATHSCASLDLAARLFCNPQRHTDAGPQGQQEEFKSSIQSSRNLRRLISNSKHT